MNYENFFGTEKLNHLNDDDDDYGDGEAKYDEVN